MSLREQQQAFADAIFAAPGASLSLVPGDAGRLAIYRRSIFANYRNALGATYPVVRRMLGAALFQSAVDDYVSAHPSTCGDLNVYGDRFGDFLERYAPAGKWTYIADVARLEWAIDDAHRAPDAVRDPEAVLRALATAPPERLPTVRLRLDPSCRLVASRHPILQLWKAHQQDASGEVSENGGGALLIRRDAQGVPIERLSAGDHAWLMALAGGATLGESIEAAQTADHAFDLGASLRAHIAAGTIVAVVDDD